LSWTSWFKETKLSFGEMSEYWWFYRFRMARRSLNLIYCITHCTQSSREARSQKLQSNDKLFFNVFLTLQSLQRIQLWRRRSGLVSLKRIWKKPVWRAFASFG
jgi:hypothetical protein